MFESLDTLLARLDRNGDKKQINITHPTENVFEKYIRLRDLEEEFGIGLERRYRLWIPFNDLSRKLRDAKYSGGTIGHYSIAVGFEVAENIIRIGGIYVLYEFVKFLYKHS